MLFRLHVERGRLTAEVYILVSVADKLAVIFMPIERQLPDVERAEMEERLAACIAGQRYGSLLLRAAAGAGAGAGATCGERGMTA